MKGSFKLGTIAEIGVFIHWTFSLLIIFIIYINYKSGQDIVQIVWSVVFLLSVFITVLLHELGHAVTAKKYNIKTKDITLLPIGGIARLERIPEKPSEELNVALAGPMVNVVLAILTFFFIEYPKNPEEMIAQLSGGVNGNNFLLNFFLANVILALFNLIPAFPMDGGRILRAILSFKLDRNLSTKIAATIGQLIAIGFIILGFSYNPFLILIGIFVIMSAQIEKNFTESKFILKDYKVKDVLMTKYLSIESTELLKTAVTLLLDSQSKDFLITQNSTPIGTLNRNEIIKALSEKGDNEPIYTIMNRNLIFLDANSHLEDVFELIYKNKSSLMLVMENNEMIGTLDTENLMEFLLIKEVKSKKSDAK